MFITPSNDKTVKSIVKFQILRGLKASILIVDPVNFVTLLHTSQYDEVYDFYGFEHVRYGQCKLAGKILLALNMKYKINFMLWNHCLQLELLFIIT